MFIDSLNYWQLCGVMCCSG